jgi:mRNA interferase RelE/StbE
VGYTIRWSSRAAKAYERLQNPTRQRIANRIKGLADDPRPSGCEPLQGSSYLRVRVGDYRIVYEVRDTELRVLIVLVGHRREVYRDLGNA